MNNYVENDDLENIRQIFFEECGEQLSLLEEELSSLEGEKESGEKINTIFRAVHSIKGGAGAFGMEKLVRFSHLFEAVLEKFRSGECVVSHASIATFLKAADVLSDIVAFYRDGTDFAVQDDINEELNLYLKEVENHNEIVGISENIDGILFNPIKIDVKIDNTFFIKINTTIEFYKNGDDILNILHSLSKLGAIISNLDDNVLPDIDLFDLRETYATWYVEIKTTYSKDLIEEIFEWSGNNLEVQFLDNFNKLQEENNKKPNDENKEFSYRKESITIRVDTQRIDNLVDLLSELVINQGAIRTQMRINNVRPGSDLDIVISELEQLTHEMQENVMAMRAHPIKMVFQRMGRIVRETSRISEKKVVLHLEGEDTEVDRFILEKLSDPLTHMVRNAIDHGLEDADLRMREGKTAEGNLFLRAFHHSGRIIIEVEDDGAGLNCDKIYKKALSKGIIKSDFLIEKDEIENLIFSPGFSTVDNISDLSGRGVGMDVVKKSISEIGGNISIYTQKNKGTLFSISLPLTLAVVEGLIFRVEKQNFIVPVSSVVEAFLFQKNKMFEISENAYGYPYRDEYIPIVNCYDLINNEHRKELSNSCLIIENEKKSKIAIMVDEIIDQSKFVIKSIEENYKKVSGFSSATILGDGSVALIVDVDFLVESFSLRKSNKNFDFGE